MTRRRFIQAAAVLGAGGSSLPDLGPTRLEDSLEILDRATRTGQVRAATIYVSQRNLTVSRHFGSAGSNEAIFLLGSISKPITVTALMTLYDRGEFKLEDRLKKFLPKFSGDQREEVTIQNLLTHASGLPDQLSNNDGLRRRHATLNDFVEHAIKAPLAFRPGASYRYSSMGILLAARVAEVISGTDIKRLVEQTVFRPLKMEKSAQGLGRFQPEDLVQVQTEHAAPEAGGDPNAKDWDWNSPYWRKLGAPWGGSHSCGPDLGKFLGEFLHEAGACVKPETARLMTKNHNLPGLTARGFGFDLSLKGPSQTAFGHTGSTGTIAWADPASSTICVVLTSLPAGAVQPHPRDLAAKAVTDAVR